MRQTGLMRIQEDSYWQGSSLLTAEMYVVTDHARPVTYSYTYSLRFEHPGIITFACVSMPLVNIYMWVTKTSNPSAVRFWWHIDVENHVGLLYICDGTDECSLYHRALAKKTWVNATTAPSTAPAASTIRFGRTSIVVVGEGWGKMSVTTVALNGVVPTCRPTLVHAHVVCPCRLFPTMSHVDCKKCPCLCRYMKYWV